MGLHSLFSQYTLLTSAGLWGSLRFDCWGLNFSSVLLPWSYKGVFILHKVLTINICLKPFPVLNLLSINMSETSLCSRTLNVMRAAILDKQNQYFSLVQLDIIMQDDKRILGGFTSLH